MVGAFAVDERRGSEMHARVARGGSPLQGWPVASGGAPAKEDADPQRLVAAILSESSFNRSRVWGLSVATKAEGSDFARSSVSNSLLMSPPELWTSSAKTCAARL